MDNKKVNNIIKIPITQDIKFFRCWLELLTPYHKLTPREIDVAAEFLNKRFELSKSITDNNLLDKILMNEETKAEIRKICGVNSAHFQVIMGKLRKAKFIVDNRVNYKFIPKNLHMGDKAFQMLFYFAFDE